VTEINDFEIVERPSDEGPKKEEDEKSTHYGMCHDVGKDGVK
jgi:hypothetical protein